MIRILRQQGHRGTRLLASMGIGVLLSGLVAGCGSDNDENTGGTSTLKATEFAYVVNQDDNTVSQLAVASNGRLTPLTPATITIPANALDVIVPPNKQFAYVTEVNLQTGAASASQFQIQADGTLTLVNTINATPTGGLQDTGLTKISSAQAAQFPLAFGLLQFNFTFDPAGKFAYLTTLGAKVLQYQVNADSTLTALSPTNVLAGSAPRAVTVDPTGTFAYIANQDTTVSLFQIGANGALTSLSPPTQTVGHRPVSITLFQPAKAAARALLGRSR